MALKWYADGGRLNRPPFEEAETEHFKLELFPVIKSVPGSIGEIDPHGSYIRAIVTLKANSDETVCDFFWRPRRDGESDSPNRHTDGIAVAFVPGRFDFSDPQAAQEAARLWAVSCVGFDLNRTAP